MYDGIPNCVPEYFRSMFDDQAREYELEMKRRDYYEGNKAHRMEKRKEGCAELAFYPEECIKCPCGEEAGPESENDDWPVMICGNWKNCGVFRREMDEKFPEHKAGSEDSWVNWLLEDTENAGNGETKGE